MSWKWWTRANGPSLAQGDLLPDCLLPIYPEEPVPMENEELSEVEVKQQRLIIVTQSCDLENNKVQFVALCPIHTLTEFEESNPRFKNKKEWERVRRGNQHALHMLASPDAPDDNLASYVVDFGHIVSLPYEYLTRHAEKLGEHWRLGSPFLEHFSQAFARFFMRVGLPSSIPPFK